MENKRLSLKYLPLVLCAVFLWGYTILDLVTPDQVFSDMENRYLTQAPAPSIKSLVSNAWTMKYEEYTNDQFAARNLWITLKSVTESALGKLENNGIIYGKDHYMFEKKTSLDDTQLGKNIAFVTAFREKHPDDALYFSLIPNSYAVLDDKLPPGLHNIPQLELVEEYQAQAEAAGWNVIDLVPVLREHNQEYIYYRTDHHWTSYGAYLAYETMSGPLQFSPVTLDSLPAAEVPDFYGTYYSKAKLFSTVPDTITWYDVTVGEVVIDGETVDGIYDLDQFDQRDKYAAFLRGNNGLMVIEGANTGDGSRLLIFKDSYGNSVVPLLSQHYSELYIVDLRYYSELDQLMENVSFDGIYLLYNFDSFSTDTHLAKLQ